jgi:molybdate transport system ATP-binding protein
MAIYVDIEKKTGGVLRRFTFDSTAATVGVLGNSGSGRTLLLRCIAGVETPDRGKIQIHGKTVYDSEKHVNLKPSERRIGYLVSDYALFPKLSVEQNIACGYRGKRKEKEHTVEEYIRRFELEGLEDELPGKLNDEQRQRVALARMMIAQPQILLMDEPLLGSRRELLWSNLVRYLKLFDGGYLFASQDPNEIYALCSWSVILEDGSVLAKGETKELFSQPGSVRAAQLTGCQNFSRVAPLDEYHVRALDWGIALRTAQKVEAHITHVGIRSHAMCTVDEYTQNCLPVQCIAKREGLTSLEFQIRNAREPESSELVWKSSKGTDVPPYLYLPPEQLMLLGE